MTIKLQFPPDTEIDPKFVTWAEQALAAAGINQQQATAIATAWQGYTTERVRTERLAAEASHQQEVDRVKASFGKDWEGAIAAGRKAVRSLGLDNEALHDLEATLGLSSTLHLMAKLGRHVASGDAPGQDKIRIPSPEQAGKSIEDLQADPEFMKALHDARHVKHAEAARTWEQAHAARYPAQGPDPAAPPPPPKPAATPAASTPTKREAALARIEQLKGDSAFQDRMRDHSNPSRASALQEWNNLFVEAYADGQ